MRRSEVHDTNSGTTLSSDKRCFALFRLDRGSAPRVLRAAHVSEHLSLFGSTQSASRVRHRKANELFASLIREADELQEGWGPPVQRHTPCDGCLSAADAAADRVRTCRRCSVTSQIGSFGSIRAHAAAAEKGKIRGPVLSLSGAEFYDFHAEFRIMEQKFSRLNEGSRRASTSSFMVPDVVSGLWQKPS